MSTEIKFVDTTVRDGNQSLWALNMRAGMMLTALPALDEAGFEAMEFLVPGVQVKKMAQHLGEDPFQWLKLGTAARQEDAAADARRHPRRAQQDPLARSAACWWTSSPPMASATTRTSDPWNDFPRSRAEIEDLRDAGMQHGPQHHLLRVAQAHRRVLCRARQAGGRAASRGASASRTWAACSRPSAPARWLE